MTKIELELMTNYEMHLFMEEGIRGGVSTITHRYAEAKNHYMDNFDAVSYTHLTLPTICSV